MHRTASIAPILLAAACAGNSIPDPEPMPETAAPTAAPAAPTEVEATIANNGQVLLSGMPGPDPSMRARLNPYQEVRGASFADWSADGDAIYIATRFANVSQLHRVAMPMGARRQLTFGEEPIGGAERRPGREELLYAMDEGGSEFDQLWLFDPNTGRARRLTDGASRNGAASFSPDGDRLAFTSTRRNGRSNDVWLMDPDDPDAARVIVEAPDGSYWLTADWSPDGRRLLIGQYVSINDSRVHLLDLDSGELTRLLGGDDAPAAHGDARFDATGRGILFTSDARGEFNALYHARLQNDADADGATRVGDWREVAPGIDWDVEGIVLSKDRTRAAFAVNENGRSVLYLLDPSSLEHRAVPDLPVGLLGGVVFSPDGSRIGLTMNTATSPSDAWSLELGGPLEVRGRTRWTESEVGGLNPETFVEPEAVAYETWDGREIPAWLYVPRGEGPHPVVVYIHGGPESQYRPGFSSIFQSWIAELGVAVIAPNVRGSSGYGKTYLTLDNAERREDSVRDIGALLDWIAARPELDQERVVVYGGSYGGYMVLASLVHYSDRLAGGVDIVGISDFRTFLQNTQDYRRDLRRAEYGDERDPAMAEFFDRVSPLRQASRIHAPLFVVQGQNDPRVPATEAEQIVRAVRDSGYDVWYMNALNEGHGYARKENADLLRDYAAMFIAGVVR